MKPWPQAHKNLAAFLLLAVITAIGCYFFLVRPKLEQVQEMNTTLEDLRKKL